MKPKKRGPAPERPDLTPSLYRNLLAISLGLMLESLCGTFHRPVEFPKHGRGLVCSGEEIVVFKIGLALVTALASQLIGVALAADKIALTCSGFSWRDDYSKQVSANETLVIDLDRGTVTGSIYHHGFSITEVTDDHINFCSRSGATCDHNLKGSGWLGSVNRVTGKTLLNQWWGTDLLPVLRYVLTCKQAKPLF